MRIEVYDVLGQMVTSEALMNGKGQVNLQNHTAGIYTYRILNRTEMVADGKLIKLK